jgi:non-specific serine/threonine protein kinase/serine/threonine-protein kinase
VNAERWGEVRRCLEEALEKEGPDRAAYVEALSGRDEALGSEVARLVASSEAAGEFLEAPAVVPDEGLAPGTVVGSWRVVREIGKGGMGRVFLAVRADGAFRHEAALKVVSAAHGGAGIERRFRTERQILASLVHPNIARLLDGGTTADGRPFFVMEHVAGEHLTAYAAARELSLEAKLTLFRKVCAAVSHAHQHLVVHRDLKPGNILVTEGGEPKLLDFGLAKVLGPAASELTPGATGVLGRLMTPEYASPEQVRGDTITTASDVYSLGVVLFELVSGRLPFVTKGRSAEMIARTICEEEPARLGGRAGADLECVVAMALRKEPPRRYATVEQLSEDVQRVLDGKPVRAQRDTIVYRARKFLGRHRVSASLAAAAALLLVTVAAVALRQARVAQLERERAERRYDDVRKLVKSILFEQYEAIQDLPGTTAARALLVRRALEQLGALEREAGPDFPLRTEMADAYEKLGDVLGSGVWSSLGDSAGARSAYEKALDLRARVVSTPGATDKDRAALARSQERYASFLARANEIDAAITRGRVAISILNEIAEKDPKAGEGPGGRASAHHLMGYLLSRSGAFRAALGEYVTSERLFREALALAPEDLAPRRGVGMSLYDQAAMRQRLEEPRAALDTGLASLEWRQRLLKQQPTNTRLKFDVASSLKDVSEYLGDVGDVSGALERVREADRIIEELADADPKNAYMQMARANVRNELGDLERRSGDARRAIETQRSAAAVAEQVVDADPDCGYCWVSLAHIYAATGDARLALKGPAPEPSACDHWRRSAEIWNRLSSQGRLPGEDVPQREALLAKLASCPASRVAR